MAKSSRASRTKTNRSALRARVFGPIEDARAERLSARLMEVANQTLPEKSEGMELDSTETSKSSKKATKPSTTDDQDIAMEVDIEMDKAAGKSTSSRKPRTGRVQKKRRGKATSTITFPNKDRRKIRAKGKQRK